MLFCSKEIEKGKKEGKSKWNILGHIYAMFKFQFQLTLLNYNVTFAEKENPIKIPNMRKRFEELKSKKKTIKKSTRRTVQKIIKKMRRKVYLNAPTAMPTLTNRNQSNTEGTKNVPTATTEQVYQKMHKKQIKIPRYPMPFQKLAHNRESLRNERMHMRNKRNVEKSDLLIFNDLDEMEFVKEKNGYNVVNAHVQRHWR